MISYLNEGLAIYLSNDTSLTENIVINCD
jgi:hypothetical protein